MIGRRVFVVLGIAMALFLAGCMHENGEETPDETPAVTPDPTPTPDDTIPDNGGTDPPPGDMVALAEQAMRAFLLDLGPGGSVNKLNGAMADPGDPDMPDEFTFQVDFGNSDSVRYYMDASPTFEAIVHCHAGGVVFELVPGEDFDEDYDDEEFPTTFEARTSEACIPEEFFGEGVWDEMDEGLGDDSELTNQYQDTATGWTVLVFEGVGEWGEQEVFRLWIDEGQGRLMRLEVEDDMDSWMVLDIGYGSRGALPAPPAAEMRIPAEVWYDEYVDDDGTWVWFAESPWEGGYPLDEFEVRIYHWEDLYAEDPGEPVAVFDPTGPPGQSENGFTFTFYDANGDGLLNEGDSFEVVDDLDGGWAWEDYIPVMWDLWADGPVDPYGMGIPGPGIVVVLLLVGFGGYVLHRRRA